MGTKLFEFIVSRKTLSSFAVFGTLLGVGLVTASFGPALPLLSAQTNSTTETVSILFTGQSAGYLAGTLISGPLLDRVTREGVFLGLSIVLGGLCNIAVPFPRSIVLVIALCILQGISFGALDCGGSVAILRLHGLKVAPWMAAMHFSFALGTTISPFIVGAIIDSTGGIVISFIIVGVITAILGALLVPVPSFKNATKTVTTSSTEQPTTAASSDSPKEASTAISTTSPSRPKVRPAVFWAIVVLAGLFLLAYSTVEATWGSFLATYAINTNTTNIVNAAFMTSGFWGSFCAGRLANIPLAFVVSAEAMLAISLTGCIIAILPLLIWPGKLGVLWAIVCVYGFLMGPIWASLWSTLGKHVEVSGKAATVVEFGASIGNLTMPVTVGALITRIGPQVLPIQQLISIGVCMIVYIIILVVLHCCNKPYLVLESPSQTPQLDEHNNDTIDIIEMTPNEVKRS